MALGALAVPNAEPRGKADKLADSGGLYLFVSPSGGCLWRLNYRFDGKQKALTFGKYPDVSLAKVRDRRAAARELIAD